MSSVTDISADAVAYTRLHDTAAEAVPAADAQCKPEDDLLITSSDPASVVFKQINHEDKLEKYLTAKNLTAYTRQAESMAARATLIAHETAIVSSEVLLSAVSDDEPEADILTQLSLLGEEFTESGIDNLQSEGIKRITALSTEKTVSSSKEICAAVTEAIGDMSASYLDVFQQAVEKNLAFYTDFTDFMAKLSGYISANDDKTVLKAQDFANALLAVIAKYPVPDLSTTLYPCTANGVLAGTSQEDCVAWAKMMGLDENKSVSKLDDGTFIVHIDILPLNNILSTLPVQSEGGYPSDWSMNSAQWAAWQAGLDIQKDTVQTSMQTLTQRYTNANSTFDNLVKVLSSVINSLLDSDKSFFNI